MKENPLLNLTDQIDLNLRWEMERQSRKMFILFPRDQKEFEANLMWMTQNGSEKEYLLFLKLSKNPPFDSKPIQYFFKKALEKTKPSLVSFQAIHDKHCDLLDKYRDSEDQEISAESQKEIENFLYQIRNVGLYLDDREERKKAKDILNDWLEKLQNMGLNPPELYLQDYDPDIALQSKDQYSNFTPDDNQEKDPNMYKFSDLKYKLNELTDTICSVEKRLFVSHLRFREIQFKASILMLISLCLFLVRNKIMFLFDRYKFGYEIELIGIIVLVVSIIYFLKTLFKIYSLSIKISKGKSILSDLNQNRNDILVYLSKKEKAL